MRRMISACVVAAALFAMSCSSSSPQERHFHLMNLEYNGAKIWLPGTLVVHKGDTVHIDLTNKIKGGDEAAHGFEVVGYSEPVVLQSEESKMISFVADKAGIFDIKCQLHAGHIGGQLIVLDH